MRIKTVIIPVLLLSLVIASINPAFGQDLLIEIKSDGAGEISAVFTPEKGLDMGAIKSNEKRDYTIKFKNSLKKDLEFGPMRSPCVCIDLDNSPEKLASGEEASFKMKLDGESYRGTFNKFMHVRLKTSDTEKDVFLPIKFTITDEDGGTTISSPAPLFEGPVKFVDYKGGGLEKHSQAKAWIFAGKACPGCNFLKSDLLPKLLEKEGIEKIEAVMVDLDVKENFIFLTELEERLNVKGDKTPVLYWKGKLIYGNEQVKKLISAE